ncbi:hypothetical protein PanWU01x14_075390 [Parasponia andersonii]|uniref:Uncharacterized protein n=1 Tax=Parasponia andersonii TaxID=3476 RepID=A0A2P5DCW9_PARAD|nr:hypothetical protein PanWU01x14_075390 [Parasponia andersonii]
MNFDKQSLGVDRRRRDKTPLARGVENGGQTALRLPENLTGGRIFAGPLLRLRLMSKRGGTGGVGFIFECPLKRAMHWLRREAVRQLEATADSVFFLSSQGLSLREFENSEALLCK